MASHSYRTQFEFMLRRAPWQVRFLRPKAVVLEHHGKYSYLTLRWTAWGKSWLVRERMWHAEAEFFWLNIGVGYCLKMEELCFRRAKAI
jgi:hypothetical protein